MELLLQLLYTHFKGVHVQLHSLRSYKILSYSEALKDIWSSTTWNDQVPLLYTCADTERNVTVDGKAACKGYRVLPFSNFQNIWLLLKFTAFIYGVYMGIFFSSCYYFSVAMNAIKVTRVSSLVAVYLIVCSHVWQTLYLYCQGTDLFPSLVNVRALFKPRTVSSLGVSNVRHRPSHCSNR